MDQVFFLILAFITVALLLYGFTRKSGVTTIVGAILLIVLSSVVIGEGVDTVYKSNIIRNDMNQITQITQTPDRTQSISGYNSSTVNLFSYMGISLGMIIIVYAFWKSFGQR